MTVTTAFKTHVQVLVVDDSDDQRMLLIRFFERAGCVVVGASDAEEAMASYRTESPDLAVVDLRLPGMSGWELSTQLRGDIPGCKIVISSVLDGADYPDSDAVLPKPFTGADVRRVLEQCVPGWSG
jgi:CheY-like chemotaxis protein